MSVAEQLNSLHNFSVGGLNEKCAFTVMDRSTDEASSLYDFSGSLACETKEKVGDGKIVETRVCLDRCNNGVKRQGYAISRCQKRERRLRMYDRTIEKFHRCIYGETISLPLIAFREDLMGIRPAGWTD